MVSNSTGNPVHRRVLLQSIGAATGTALLAGCAGDESGSDGDPSHGGTLEISSADDPENLDPHTTTINVAQLALENVVEGLFEIDENLEPAPVLAEDYERNDDGTVYDITLKEGVQFHDPIGGEMTADDVEYTVNRILDPDLGSPRAQNFEMVEEIETPSDYEVRFILSEPFAPFLAGLTEGAGIIPAGASDEVELQRHPVGTGPFSFEEWRTNELLRLKRFEDYHRDDRPYLEGINFNVIPEAATRLTQLQTGSAHVMYGIPFQNAEQIESDNNTELQSTSSIWKQSLWFNTNEEPFDIPEVRHAVNHAIDREQFVQGVLFGQGEVAHSPVPSVSDWSDRIDGGDPVEYDLSRAEELLDEAGVDPSSISTSIKASRTPGPTFADTATLVQSQLSQLGMDIDIEILDFSTWLDEVWVSNDFDMSIGSWSGRTDPDGWYYRQYHSEGVWNHWGYENDEVDDLVEQGRTTTDEDERADIYSEVDRIVSEDLPMAYLYFREDMTGLRNEVGGYELTAANQAQFHDTYLNE